MDALFGNKQKGPSDAEKAMQQERAQSAIRADGEADQKAALMGRASSLRKSLAFNDREKRRVLGA